MLFDSIHHGKAPMPRLSTDRNNLWHN